jgi:hypothetical protein
MSMVLWYQAQPIDRLARNMRTATVTQALVQTLGSVQKGNAEDGLVSPHAGDKDILQ